MTTRTKQLCIGLLATFLLVVPLTAAPSDPVQVRFQDIFIDVDNRTLVDGDFPVTINLLSTDPSWPGWESVYPSLTFTRGAFSVNLGSRAVLTQGDFDHPGLFIRMNVNEAIATFPISAVPFAISVKFAESVDTSTGFVDGANVTQGVFASMNVNAGFVASSDAQSNIMHIPATEQKVGIRKVPEFGALDVAGTINASALFLDGVAFRDALAWKDSPLDANNIGYTSGGFVGVSTARPRFPLEVRGTINVAALHQGGVPLARLFDWSVAPADPGVSPNIFYDEPNSAVGIGTVAPQALLESRFAIAMGTTASENAGALRFTNGQFQGFNGEVGRYFDLTGIEGGGDANNFAFWDDTTPTTDRMNFSSQMTIDPVNHLIGLNVNIPSAAIDVKGSTGLTDLMRLRTVTNNAFFRVLDSGKVLVNTNNSTYALNVGPGGFNSGDLFVNGLPLRLSISTGTFWFISTSSNIYYLLDRVGIGRPPGPGESQLKISQIQGLGSRPNPLDNQDPAISLSIPGQSTYTLGVDAADIVEGITNQVFRVESGARLGEEQPLFVVQTDRLGIGVRKPSANLTVSGSSGIIFGGDFDLENTANAVVEGAGTRLLWHPVRAAFRVGQLETDSPFTATEWNGRTMGRYSVGFGLNPYPSGNFTAVGGGEDNVALGAFSTISGGLNNRTGDFATMALGRNAKATHFGSYVWSDARSGDFETTTHNQYILRADNGFAVNTTNTTVFRAGLDRPVSFTLAARVVDDMDFIPIVNTSANSQLIYNKLRQTDILSSRGTVTDNFSLSTPLDLTGITLSGGLSTVVLEPTIRAFLGNIATRNILMAMDDPLGTPRTVSFAITSRGHLAVGTTEPVDGRLTVMDSNMGIATENPTARLVVNASPDPIGKEAIFQVFGHNVPTPAVIINSSGNIGMGLLFPASANGSAEVPILRAPTIAADSFVFPSGVALSADPPLIVWTTTNILPVNPADLNADRSIGNIYYISGNVGIGMPSPNGGSLELSDLASVGSVLPIIGFQDNTIDTFGMGIMRRNPEVFAIGLRHGSPVPTPPFAVTKNAVGFGTLEPSANLHVVGATHFTNGLVVNDTLTDFTTPNVFTTSMNALVVLIDRTIVTPWKTATPHIYHDTAFNPTAVPPQFSFVGIGTQTPNAELAINGTMNVVTPGDAHSIIISNRMFVEGRIISDKIDFHDGDLDEVISLKVSANKLVLEGSDGTRDVSDSIHKATGIPGRTTSMMVWGQDANGDYVLTNVAHNMFWTNPLGADPGGLSISGNIISTKSVVINQASALHHTYINTPAMDQTVRLHSILDHGDSLSHPESFTVQRINTDIDFSYDEFDWAANHPLVGGELEKVDVRGVDITMRNPTDNFFTRRGTLIGLQSDVTNVAVQAVGDKGFKYPFIAVSGNVGIGTSEPLAELEVIGTVDADFFQIGQRITVTTLNMGSANLFVGTPNNRVGFNTNDPQAELDIRGVFEGTTLKSQGLDANSFLVNQANFVAQSGKVGFGTTDLNAQFTLKKSFNILEDTSFTFQSIHATANASGTSTGDFVGLNINVLSSQNASLLTRANRLGSIESVGKTAKGLVVDLASMSLEDDQTLVGLEVIVSSSVTSNRRAAILKGGKVAINTDTPSSRALLTVKGGIYATNVPSINFLTDQETGSFNILAVESTTVTTPIANRLFANNMVINNLTQRTIDVGSSISLNIDLTVEGTYSSQTTSINGLVSASVAVINKTVSANTGRFNALSIGTTPPDSAIMGVDGGIRTQTLDGTIDVRPVALVVNDSAINAAGSGVHIGRTGTNHALSIEQVVDATFAANDNTRWQGLFVQNKSTALQRATGVVIAPGTVDSDSNGSGFAAIRSHGSSPFGSHLAFITDPNDGDSVERMRISATGNVGIGHTQPEAKLHVIGNMDTTELTPKGLLRLSGIEGLSSGTTIVSTVNITPTLSVHGTFAVNRDILFDKTATKAATAALSALSVAQSNKLAYSTLLDGGVISGNVGVTPSSVTRLNLPFFTASRKQAAIAELNWVTTNVANLPLLSTLSLEKTGSLSAGQSVSHYKSFVTSTNASSSTLLTLKNVVTGRSTASTSKFIGVDIVATASQLASNGADTTVAGIRVSMDATLETISFLPSGERRVGNKIAATFLTGGDVSGNWIIYPSANATFVRASADVHINTPLMQTPALFVTAKDSDSNLQDALIVSANNYVGIGDTQPASKLTVTGKNTTDPIVSFLDSDAKVLMQVGGDGSVGVAGIATPGIALKVNGRVSASQMTITGITANILEVSTANGGLVVNSAGDVGVGSATPVAQLHLSKSFAQPSDLSSDFNLEELTVTLSGSISVTRNLAGLFVNIDSESTAKMSLDSGTDTHTAKGLDIDLPLTLLDGSSAIGLDVTIPPSTNVQHMVARFMGGRVGIGTTQPASPLHIVGTLQGRNMTGVTPNLQVASSTLTKFSVANNATANTIRVITGSGNPNGRFIVPGTWTVSTDTVFNTLSNVPIMSAETMTVTTQATTDVLTLGGVSEATLGGRALTVSGDAKVTGELTITENLLAPILSAPANLSLPTATITSTLNLTASASMFADAVRLIRVTEANFKAVSGYGGLYTNDSDGEKLYYHFVSGSTTITANLNDEIRGTATRIPFYSPSTVAFSTTEKLRMLQTQVTGKTYTEDKLVIGQDAQFETNLTLLNDVAFSKYKGSVSANRSFADNVIAKRIRTGFLNRGSITHTAVKPVIKGMDIVLDGTLDDNEFTYGLNITMNMQESSTELPLLEDTTINATFIAATFRNGDGDGTVGVVLASNNITMQPQAELHISGNYKALPPLRVSADQLAHGLLVTTNGQVGTGLGAFTSPAHFHVHHASTTLFKVVNSSDAALIQSKDGNKIGIGTTNPEANVHIVGTTSLPAFQVGDNTIVVSQDGKIGFGTSHPSKNVDIFFNRDAVTSESFTVNNGAADDSNWIQITGTAQPFGLTTENVVAYTGCGANDDVFAGVITRNGQAFLYDITCDHSLTKTVKLYDDETPFRIAGNTFVVEPDGSIGIGSRVYPNAVVPFKAEHAPAGTDLPITYKRASDLLVSGNIIVGTSTTSDLPDWFTTTSTKPDYIGLIAGVPGSTHDDYAALGLFSETNHVGQYNPVINYGTTTGDIFVIERNGTELMRFMPDAQVKIGTTLPSVGNLTLQGSGTERIMQISSGARPNIFVMDSDTNIGVGTASPSANLHVNGTVQVDTIAVAPSGSSLLLTTTLNITNQESGKNREPYKVIAPVNSDLGQTESETKDEIRVNLTRDIPGKRLVGMGIDMASNATMVNNNTPNFYGVRIDMSDVSVSRPVSTHTEGERVAASFIGGASVMIGTESATNNRGLLTVVPLKNGQVLVTGNIATFKTTSASILAQSRADVTQSMTIAATGNTVQTPIMTPKAFEDLINVTTGHPLTPTNLSKLWKSLIDNLIVSPTSFRVTTNTSALSSTSLFNGLNLRSKSYGVDILKNHVTADVFIIKSHEEYDDTVASAIVTKNAFVYLLSGVKGHRDTPEATVLPGRMGVGFLDVHTFGETDSDFYALFVSRNNVKHIDSELTVSGDMRVGVSENTSVPGSAGYGKVLLFSGGFKPALFSTALQSPLDSENNDTLWMSRFNTAVDETELRMGLGEGSTSVANSQFSIGSINKYYDFQSTHNVFKAGVFNYVTPVVGLGVANGRVGIAENGITNNPVAILHVKGSTSADTAGQTLHVASPNYLMVVENNNTTSREAGGLAISHSAATLFGTASNYISFMRKGDSVTSPDILGAIQGDGTGGISYASPEADFAEYLPKQDPSERIRKADIVGVKHGRISKTTHDADQLMVMSSSPIVAGNWQGRDDHPDYGLVAFLGQVPVRIRGEVTAGDYILPSGKGDGTGIAMAGDDIPDTQIDSIIGRAWESSKKKGVKKIKTVVGFPFSLWVRAERKPSIDTLQQSILAARSKNDQLETTYAETLRKRELHILELREKVLSLKQQEEAL